MRETIEQNEPDTETGERPAPENSGEAGHSVTLASEEIHIRNFDVRRAYDLTIKVRDGQELIFANRYYLTPGKTVRERNCHSVRGTVQLSYRCLIREAFGVSPVVRSECHPSHPDPRNSSPTGIGHPETVRSDPRTKLLW